MTYLDLLMLGAGVLCFAAVLLCFIQRLLSSAWSVRRHRRKMAGPMLDAEAVDMGQAPTGYPAGYEHVAEAWSRAIKLSPEHRDELLEASAICARLLTALECRRDLPDSAMIETAALISYNLAVLVDSTERRLRDARPSERAAIAAEMLEFLLGFARRAQRDMQAAKRRTEDRDTALRAHLSAQLSC